MLQLAASDRGAASQIWTMCSEDPLFYVAAFCFTYDPRLKLATVPFVPYDFQCEAMLEINECIEIGQDFAMPKSRDMGASWMGLTIFEWRWKFRAMQSFLMVSRNESYVDKSDNPKANPYVKIANDALALMIRLACEFGITPASSAKVNANPVVVDEKSELLKRLQKGG
jgi:hypothetical protein